MLIHPYRAADEHAFGSHTTEVAAVYAYRMIRMSRPPFTTSNR
jgi:hypothetical protein